MYVRSKGLLVPNLTDTVRLRQRGLGDDWQQTRSGLYAPQSYVPEPALPVAVDLFAGAGGFSLGIIQAGFQVVAALDADVDAAITYTVNLGAFPMQFHYATKEDEERLEKKLKKSLKKNKNGVYYMSQTTGSGFLRHHPEYSGVEHFFLGDARQFTGQQILDAIGMQRGEVDLVCGGPPCFAAGTMVLTRRGYRPIEGIKPGDQVLTHRGLWRPVTAVMRRENVRTQIVSAQGSPRIVTTADHPFYARKWEQTWNNRRRSYVRTPGPAKWVAASDLGDRYYIGQVLPQTRCDDKHSPAFWWLVGRYLADGWLSKRHNRPSMRVYIAAGPGKEDELERRIRDAGFKAYRAKGRTCTRFEVHGVALGRFLAQFGRGAHRKTIPGFCYEISDESARALLEGYLAGDGQLRTSGVWRATTASKSLALGIALLAQKVFGVVATVMFWEMPRKTTIEGRLVNQRDQWQVAIPRRNRSAFLEDGYGWKYVRKSDPGPATTVYNLEVADDESYVADGAIVHNCQGFSTAGKRDVMDPRNSLVFEFARLVLEILPKSIVMENVPGMLSMKTVEGHLVIDELCAILERGGFGGADALKAALVQTSGAGAALRGTRPGSQAGKKDKGEAEQLALNF